MSPLSQRIFDGLPFGAEVTGSKGGKKAITCAYDASLLQLQRKKSLFDIFAATIRPKFPVPTTVATVSALRRFRDTIGTARLSLTGRLLSRSAPADLRPYLRNLLARCAEALAGYQMARLNDHLRAGTIGKLERHQRGQLRCTFYSSSSRQERQKRVGDILKANANNSRVGSANPDSECLQVVELYLDHQLPLLQARQSVGSFARIASLIAALPVEFVPFVMFQIGTTFSTSEANLTANGPARRTADNRHERVYLITFLHYVFALMKDADSSRFGSPISELLLKLRLGLRGQL